MGYALRIKRAGRAKSRMKRLMLGTAWSWLAMARGEESVDGVLVFGRPEFRKAIASALAFLRSGRHPPAETISANVKWIIEGGDTFTLLKRGDRATMIVSAARALDPANLVGLLANQACYVEAHRLRGAGERTLKDDGDLVSRCNQTHDEYVQLFRGQPGPPV